MQGAGDSRGGVARGATGERDGAAAGAAGAAGRDARRGEIDDAEAQILARFEQRRIEAVADAHDGRAVRHACERGRGVGSLGGEDDDVATEVEGEVGNGIRRLEAAGAPCGADVGLRIGEDDGCGAREGGAEV